MDMLLKPVPEKQKTDRQVSTYADGTQICRKPHKPFIHAGFDGWVGYAEWVRMLSIPEFWALRLFGSNLLPCYILQWLFRYVFPHHPLNHIERHFHGATFQGPVWESF